MSVEEHKQVVLRFFDEVWNRRHRSAAAEIVSSACITHQLRSGAPDTSAPRGPEMISAHVAEWVTAFPDIHFSVDQVVAERDLVALHCTAKIGRAHSELQSPVHLVCRLLLEKKKN